MGYEEDIEGLRKEINRLNEEIVKKIAERMGVAVRIGTVKRKYGRPIVDASREAKVYEQIRELSGKYGVNEKGLERIFIEVIRLCIEAQMEEHP